MQEGWLFCQTTQQAKPTKLKTLVEPLKVTDTKTENCTVVGSRKYKKDTKYEKEKKENKLKQWTEN